MSAPFVRAPANILFTVFELFVFWTPSVTPGCGPAIFSFFCNCSWVVDLCTWKNELVTKNDAGGCLHLQSSLIFMSNHKFLAKNDVESHIYIDFSLIPMSGLLFQCGTHTVDEKRCRCMW